MTDAGLELEHVGAEFFDRPVVEVARSLVGCRLQHGETAGTIVEAEAYHQSEPACHAFNGPTPRASTLFAQPGTIYVYFSYGVHSLFNVVAEREGVGAAVLIRALEPVEGVDLMRVRRGRSAERELCSGPGKLTQALAIDLSHNQLPVGVGPIEIIAPRRDSERIRVSESRRIGITKAADLPWRFTAVGSVHVSR